MRGEVDAAAVIEALGGGPVTVLGHSMGGAVEFLLAAQRPDLVSALVVVDMTVLNVEPETFAKEVGDFLDRHPW